MQWLFDALAAVLAIFYSFIPHYGIAIILLTVVVMIVVTPLTVKGTRSMMIMQQLQPELKKLQEKHKDDRQKLNEEMMAFYKEHQVNPIGGCLPLLVQAPIFIVLYQVLRGLTRRENDMGFDVGWTTGQAGAGGTAAPPDILRDFDPAYLEQDTDLYISLSETNQMESFGLDLAESAAQVLSQSIIEFLPYLLLIAVVAVTGFVQQKQIQGRVRKDQVNPQQQMIMRILPVVLPIISFTLQGGLVLYFAASNLFRVGQQWWISRNIYGLKRGETVDSKEAAKKLTTADSNGDSGSEAPDEEETGDEDPEDDKAAAKKAAKKPAKKAAKKPAKKAAKKRPAKKRRSSASRPAPAVEPRGRKKKR